MSTRSSEELIEMAKLAEQCERYEEMRAMMKQVIENGVELTTEIITMLSISYRRKSTALRKSRNKIIAIEKKTRKSEHKLILAMQYREEIQAELHKICNEVILLLDKYLIPKIVDMESKVMLLKMKADYSCYLAEIATGDEKKNIKYYPGQVYKKGYEMAVSSAKMPPTHPLRLAIALNWSTYYYSVLGNRKKAQLLAQRVLDDATLELHKVPKNVVQKTIDVMKIIWDNIVIWDKQANRGASLEHKNADLLQQGEPQPSAEK
ncbi:unnamed protein product [Ceutorhynchus assimilis]|uniref:14-3-3 domain-containing protein n=1 Tax=Ceutorhynchus assimilis TaxID=467358 RepID=A0A9N9MCG2_9CUCU|nr:unnamed protein product [Ceutorhynchus assimilis]